MEYPGPIAVSAAAVVAFGDTVLIRAQDARTASPPSITQVDYLFRNMDSIEMTSQLVGGSAQLIPALSEWGVIILTMLLAGSAVLRLRHVARRHR